MAPITSEASGAKEEMVSTILADDIEIQGTIKFKSSLLIKGVLQGVILSEGLLIVGPTAKVTAAITTKNLISHGEIQGDVDAGEQIVLKSTSVQNGNLNTVSIVVENGSVFNGACTMKREPMPRTTDKTVDPTAVATEEKVAETVDVKGESPETEKEKAGLLGKKQEDGDAGGQIVLPNIKGPDQNIGGPDSLTESVSPFDGDSEVNEETAYPEADTYPAVNEAAEGAVEASVVEKKTPAEIFFAMARDGREAGSPAIGNEKRIDKKLLGEGKALDKSTKKR